jgi:biopolymer transport protein TolR
MSPLGNGNSVMSDINVTPLVDVMLVLLIIFMVTAPMMMQGVDVALPEATTEPLAAEEDHLMVSIDRDMKIFINDHNVSLLQLRDKLARILQERNDQTVYLRADRQIPYGMVMNVMDAVKGAGVERLGMVTIPPDEKDHS